MEITVFEELCKFNPDLVVREFIAVHSTRIGRGVTICVMTASHLKTETGPATESSRVLNTHQGMNIVLDFHGC
jgi:hypothetical protein